MYLVSHIRKEDLDLERHTFDMTDFYELCGSAGEGGAPYSYLKKTLKSFADKSAWVVHPDRSEELVRMLDTIKLFPDSRKVELGLHREMKPYLIQLQSDYSPFELYWVIAMKSQYSQKLYGILKSHEWKQKIITLEVDELKKQLFAGKYKNFNDFKRFALDIAMREINELTDIKVRITKIEKEGNRFARLIFSVKGKDGNEKIEAIEANEARKNKKHIKGQVPLAPRVLDEQVTWSDVGAHDNARLAALTSPVPTEYKDCKTWEELLALNERKGNKYITAFYRASRFGIPVPRGTEVPKGAPPPTKWRD